MISTLSSALPKPTEPIFPALYQAIGEKHIVFFISKTEGTIIYPGALHPRRLGHYCKWASCTDDTRWRKYEGVVNLSNS